jgi:hypothetical protein
MAIFYKNKKMNNNLKMENYYKLNYKKSFNKGKIIKLYNNLVHKEITQIILYIWFIKIKKP